MADFYKKLVHITHRLLVFTRYMNVFIFITVGHSDLTLLAAKIVLLVGGQFFVAKNKKKISTNTIMVKFTKRQVACPFKPDGGPKQLFHTKYTNTQSSYKSNIGRKQN